MHQLIVLYLLFCVRDSWKYGTDSGYKKRNRLHRNKNHYLQKQREILFERWKSSDRLYGACCTWRASTKSCEGDFPSHPRHIEGQRNIKEMANANRSSDKHNSANTRTKHKINKLYFAWCDNVTYRATFSLLRMHPLCAFSFFKRFKWLQRVHILRCCSFLCSLYVCVILLFLLSSASFKLFHIDIVRCFSTSSAESINEIALFGVVNKWHLSDSRISSAYSTC